MHWLAAALSGNDADLVSLEPGVMTVRAVVYCAWHGPRYAGSFESI